MNEIVILFELFKLSSIISFGMVMFYWIIGSVILAILFILVFNRIKKTGGKI